MNMQRAHKEMRGGLYTPTEIMIETKKDSLLTIGAFKEMLDFDNRLKTIPYI